MLLPDDSGPLDGFELFRLERALRLHFGTPDYDYFKYKGRATGARVSDYQNRRDRSLYETLSRKDQPGLRLLATLSESASYNVADVLSANGLERFEAFKKRQESLTYRFKQDLAVLAEEPQFKDNFVINEHGEYPRALKLLIKDEIGKESLIILDHYTNAFKHWLTRIQDPIMWPDYYMLLKKYSPFVRVDFAKYDALVKAHIIAEIAPTKDIATNGNRLRRPQEEPRQHPH